MASQRVPACSDPYRAIKERPGAADDTGVRLIPSRKIRDGVELARDVVNGPPGTAPLLRAGVKLSDRYATLLPKAGIGAVWIEEELGAAIETAEPLTPEPRTKVHTATASALSAAGAA